MYYKPLTLEISSPTSQATASTVSLGKAVRITNTDSSNSHVITLVDNNPQTTSVNNASGQSVLTLDNVVGLLIGDVATAANIDTGSVITAIAGNAITLDNNLTDDIDGSGTAEVIQFDRAVASMSIEAAGSLVMDKNQTQSLFAGSSLLRLTSITYPKG